jgi:hypothetical protein
MHVAIEKHETSSNVIRNQQTMARRCNYKSAVTGSTYKLKYCTSWREKVMSTVVSILGVSECWSNHSELNGIDIAKTYNTRTDG